jgi:membrane fusion protein, macrolide-specific efflux system
MKKSGWILLALIFVLVSPGCQKAKKVSTAKRFQPVPVTRDNIQITVLATGNVQPQNQLSIKPPISGRIEKLLVNEGDYVKRGQVLAQLSSTERATLLDTARSQGPEALAHWQELYQGTPLLSPQSGQIIYLPTVPGQVVSTGDTIMVMSNHLIVNTQVDETDLAQVKMEQNALITLDAYRTSPSKARCAVFPTNPPW